MRSAARRPRSSPGARPVAVSGPLATRVVTLPGDRAARIGVVADTHSRPDERALALLAKLELDVLLHAGDIGDAAVLERLEGLAPIFQAVRGNIDEALPGIPERVVVELRRGEDTLRILLLHIAVHGPRLDRQVRELALRERVDLVVCGHSHVPFATRDAQLAVFNPGSIGPRRFALPIVLGLLELGERLTVAHIDCETGRAWRPG